MKNFTQEEAIEKLEKLGFEITHSFNTFPDSEEQSVCLTKRSKIGSLHALVESNGEVNGENLSEYIQNIKKS